ncbi:MAG TPA: hypothetical protein VL916_07410 [Ilumatobacteraceae bacterium]|nr:hypothetical protein [Ilumatobacteraceae bacterium]
MSMAGAVYDRGYRPYEGPRGGRGAAVFALAKATARRALGIRRSWRQKVAPFALLAVATIPAIVNVGVSYITRDEVFNDRIEIITYRDYIGVSSYLLLFLAIVAPDVICPDLRQKVLPLIFARPITGRDYVAAKIGSITTLVFAYAVIPQLVLYIGNMLVSDDTLDYFTGHTDIVWKVPASALVVSFYFAVVSLAVSSFTNRRIVAGAAIIGTFLVTSIAAAAIIGDPYLLDDGTFAKLLDLWGLPLLLRDLIFLGRIHESSALSGASGGGIAAVAVYCALVLAGVLMLLRRYRWVER